MKAAILTAQKAPLEIADTELPKTLDYGQILVKIHYSGICGAQINEIDGVKGPDKFLPHLLGHEGGGVVINTGPGVTIVKKGDHVVLHWKKGDGIQSATPNYKWQGKTINAGWVTTFNEYAVVSENRVTPIPKNFDLKIASLFGCAITTGFGVIHNDANLKSGESILVFGAGGAGMSIIIAAQTAGAYPIIAIDIHDFKLIMAKKFGATHTLNSRQNNFKDKISKILAEGADITVDTTGINKVRELAYDLGNRSSRTILVGVPKKGEKMSIDSFPLHFDKKITGSFGGDTNPTYDIPRLIRLIKGRSIDLSPMITKIYPLDKVNEAIEEVRHGDVIRCLLKMT